MKVQLDRVEQALSRMWDERAAKGAAAHVCLANVVALCVDADRVTGVTETLNTLMPSLPGRAIVVAMEDSGEAGITADVDLVLNAKKEACGELLSVTVRGAARDWLANAIEVLLAPGGRAYVWWVGDIPDDATMFDQLTAIADVVMVNSEEMDLRDLRTLSRLVAAEAGRYSLADLNWVRLRSWQELLARFFDDPAVLPQLKTARTLTVSSAPHRIDAHDEPTSTQAALYAGWFAASIGCEMAAATWEPKSGRTRTVSVPRDGGGALAIRFEVTERADVFPGAITGIALETDDGSKFEVARQEDRHVLGWSGNCAGAVIPQAVLRVGIAQDARMLARQLDSPVRDPLFEASLAATTTLIRPLYPVDSRPPVKA